MEVILTQDVEKVGLRGEVVNVANGYARNFLLPRKLAERATPAKVAELEKRESQRARHEAASFEQGQKIAELLAKTVLRFEVKSGPTGALFGSVTPTDIADEIWRTRKVRVDRRKIGIDTIKRIGRYEVPIEVFQDVDVAVKTMVVPEGGELPPEEELAAMEAAEAAEAAAAEAAAQPAEEPAYLDELDEEPEAGAAAAEPGAEPEPEVPAEAEADDAAEAAEPDAGEAAEPVAAAEEDETV
jgi:large subunit ribosomal protein L9